MGKKQIVYISPHLDDAVLSCGGLIWEQVQSGARVQIWTLCAGDPDPRTLSDFAKSLHARWHTGPDAISMRREEDISSCRVLGVQARHFDVPDVIYRWNPHTGEPYVLEDADLSKKIDPAEEELISQLAKELDMFLDSDVYLVCPLGVGNHLDHQLARQAVERLDVKRWYYADYPYINANEETLLLLIPPGVRMEIFPISQSGINAWVEAIAMHRSQISTFWPDLKKMEEEIRQYHGKHGGIRLWITDSK
jgi:LmbE family N-acetylglucosaminyl deacetylase